MPILLCKKLGTATKSWPTTPNNIANKYSIMIKANVYNTENKNKYIYIYIYIYKEIQKQLLKCIKTFEIYITCYININ